MTLMTAYMISTIGAVGAGFCLGVLWRDYVWNKWFDDLEDEEGE